MNKTASDDKKSIQDRRVARTKRAIRLALLKILAEKSLEDVTVTELSKAADIN